MQRRNFLTIGISACAALLPAWFRPAKAVEVAETGKDLAVSNVPPGLLPDSLYLLWADWAHERGLSTGKVWGDISKHGTLFELNHETKRVPLGSEWMYEGLAYAGLAKLLKILEVHPLKDRYTVAATMPQLTIVRDAEAGTAVLHITLRTAYSKTPPGKRPLQRIGATATFGGFTSHR